MTAPKINLTELRDLDPDATGFVELDHEWLLALIATAEAAIAVEPSRWTHPRATAMRRLRETLDRFDFTPQDE